MMKHSMILVAVLAAVALVALVATRQLVVKQAPQTERSETTQPADIQIGVSIVREVGTPSLEIAVAPTDENVSVSTFALELAIAEDDGDSIATTGNIQPDETFTSASWTFPIFSATPSDDNGIIIKISGVHIATSPYQLAARQVIARIPIDPSVEPDDLVVTLGSEHTKFLTKDATPIPVDENVVVKGSAE